MASKYEQNRMKAEEAAGVHHKAMINAGVFPSCLNCEYFDELTDLCRLAGLTPPSSVIVYSCEKWAIDIDLVIPF